MEETDDSEREAQAAAAADRGGGREEGDVSALEACGACGGLPVWESVVDGWGERWLAVCGCGRIDVFFPDRRISDPPADPLTLFLQGHLRPRRPATPAWVRLFLESLQEPFSVQWRHSPGDCPQCAARTTFGLLAWPRAYVAAICTVCLNCGYTTSSYSNPTLGTTEARLEGSAWAPSCPAVQRLRDCVHQRQAAFSDQGEEWRPSNDA